MLAACRLAGLIPAWRTLCERQMARNAPTRDRSLVPSSSLALKIRRLARNSRLGDDGGCYIVGQPIPPRPRRVVRPLLTMVRT